MELDPLRTYPRRGAALIAELVGATSFRLESGGEVHESSPGPNGSPTWSFPIEGSGASAIHLHGPLTEEQRNLAEWAVGLFGRALSYAKRLDPASTERTYEDIEAMLARTPLTPRERDVVGRLLSGASTRQIASSTGLTVATVNTYLKRIFSKLGVHSRVELVARITGTRGLAPGSSGESTSEGSSS